MSRVGVGHGFLIAGAVFYGSLAHAQDRPYISVDNDCEKPLRLYIQHADRYRNWHPHGPYIFAANEGPRRLEDNGVTLTQLTNHDLYYYAELLDGSGSWSGDYKVKYDGRILRMKKANPNLVNGQLRITLSCD
jgi:hypothetical protein